MYRRSRWVHVLSSHARCVERYTQHAKSAYLGVRARAFQIYREITGGEKFKIFVYSNGLYLRLVYWLHSIVKLVYSKILRNAGPSHDRVICEPPYN
jgi:hypothetical protein